MPTSARALAVVLASAVFTAPSAAADLFAELAHASNARFTDRNLGRNFIHLGAELAEDWRVSGGVYIAGEGTCFGSLAVARTFLRGRWEAELRAHSGGTCSLDRQRVPFEPNAALCATRLLVERALWVAGIGGCLWRQADYTTGDYTPARDPLDLEEQTPQATGYMLIRWRLGATRTATRGAFQSSPAAPASASTP